MNFQGKRIVVLGGSSGIGLAVAQAAAREGAAMVIASSRRERVDQALRTLPADAEGRALDLTDEPAVRALFAELGNIDHLVFTAGENLQLDRLANTESKQLGGFSVCATGVPIFPPNTAATTSVKAARLSLPQVSPGSGRAPAGPWRLASAQRWRV